MFLAALELKRKLNKGIEDADCRGVTFAGCRGAGLFREARKKGREREAKRREEVM